jgi:hypothetical protein
MRFSALPVLTNKSSLRSGSRKSHQLTQRSEFSKGLYAFARIATMAASNIAKSCGRDSR